MTDIYLRDEFNKSKIVDRLTEISEKLCDELEKPIEEADKKKELDLYYQQLVCGMKYNIGTKYGF